ncbi:MAG: DNA N-6-adenine-methyltransferase [Comamonadaceae bacterium]
MTTLATLFDTAQPVIVALMTEAEAISAEREIITTGNRLRALLVDFYERRGWAALGYVSWRSWASARLGQHEATAYRELTAGMVEREISPMGEIGQIPERQLRPLAPLRDDPDALRETWDRANEIADDEGNPRTARHVAQAVAERRAPEPVDDEPLTPYEQQIADDVQRSQQRSILTSQESAEWYTPAWAVGLARRALGGIDLDPASSPIANQIVGASRIFTPDDDGLSQPWSAATVFVNPPYNGDSGAWCQKALTEYRAGRAGAVVLLVFAKLGYQWFEDLFDACTVCFVRKRISFRRPDGSVEGEAKHGSAFIYLGPNAGAFRAAFAEYGRVFDPEEGRR